MPLSDFYETAYLQSWISYTDDFGWPAWKFGDGAQIKVGVIPATSEEIRIAEAGGVKAEFTFMFRPEDKIEFQDVIRLVRTNALYRVIRHPLDDVPPTMATEQFMRA